MAQGKVGLYLGYNSVGGAVVDNKHNVIAAAQYDLASMEGEVLVEDINEKVKWETLINRVMREIKAEGKDVYVSISDRDFIYRSTEMPYMRNRAEVQASISYEIEKFIPFKLEELQWDYEYTPFPKDKKISLSFVGVKEENLQKTKELLTELGYNDLALEPASISLARVIKTNKKYSGLKNFAVLDYTKDESYLTFFYYDLPIFNRYIDVPLKEDGIDFDKFLDPIHRSFQYFQREFKFYSLDKFLVIGNTVENKFISALKDDLSVPVEMIMPDSLGGSKATVESIKAFGAADRLGSSYRFTPSLKKTQEQIEAEISEEAPFKTKLLIPLAGLGVVASIVAWLFFAAQYSAQETEVLRRESGVESVKPGNLKNLSWKQITTQISEKRKMVKTLEELMVTQPKVARLLGQLSELTPKGMWFDELEANETKKPGKYRAILRGYCFLGDNYRERARINEFIVRLQASRVVLDMFSGVNLVSSEHRQLRDFDVTAFTLEME